jgi:hypothetical protein
MMMGQRGVAAAIALVALLAFPRTGSAGLLDFIWEMSGPQMIGGGFACRWAADETLPQQCRVGGLRIEPLFTDQGEEPWLFLSMAGGWYFSTGKDSRDATGARVEYDFFENHMLTFEPTVEVLSRRFTPDLKMYQGLGGLTLNYLFGVDHKPFWKAGIKLTPILIEYKRWSFSANVRLYPDGFTLDQFKPVPAVGDDRPSEYTFGIGVGYIIFP